MDSFQKGLVKFRAQNMLDLITFRHHQQVEYLNQDISQFKPGFRLKYFRERDNEKLIKKWKYIKHDLSPVWGIIEVNSPTELKDTIDKVIDKDLLVGLRFRWFQLQAGKHSKFIIFEREC